MFCRSLYSHRQSAPPNPGKYLPAMTHDRTVSMPSSVTAAPVRPRAHPRHLLAYPFRVFFFLSALWAVVTVPLWMVMLMTSFRLPLPLNTLDWHQHELLFGWLQAAIAGFLLTAVCVWTKTERLHGAGLLALAGVWIAGRAVMLVGGHLPYFLVMAVTLAFLPLVMLDAGRRIVAAQAWRQLIVLCVLGLLWLMQLGFLLRPSGPWTGGAALVIIALMLVIGGRIAPGFSANWLRLQGAPERADAIRVVPWLERAMLVGLAALLAAYLVGVDPVVAVLALALAVITAVRLALWRGWRVLREPLLWILHLSLLWIPLALLLLAGSRLGWWGLTVWLHAAGVGAMGGLVLGVISRVVLGHTGRVLELPVGMATAFGLLHAGALLRVLAALGWTPWLWSVTAALLCWTAAFITFLWCYTPMLLRPRVDGRDG